MAGPQFVRTTVVRPCGPDHNGPDHNGRTTSCPDHSCPLPFAMGNGHSLKSHVRGVKAQV